MKPKLSRILFSLLLLGFSLLCGERLYAQESASSTEGFESSYDREKEPINSPGESIDRHRKFQPASPVKDSSTVVQKTSATRASKPSSEITRPEVKPSSDDDSILSFNFLYYIIQKYKLQDIVD
ncbi:MAG TPA: hypothetical protein PLJ60_01530 [Chryseolinea sp.]|nr:hypothetical protein [Chryseolinea sp.]HPM28988.1 hypothetical protein [Chryseolinea sp.]